MVWITMEEIMEEIWVVVTWAETFNTFVWLLLEKVLLISVLSCNMKHSYTESR